MSVGDEDRDVGGGNPQFLLDIIARLLDQTT
jgi:hypothetical protein